MLTYLATHYTPVSALVLLLKLFVCVVLGALAADVVLVLRRARKALPARTNENRHPYRNGDES